MKKKQEWQKALQEAIDEAGSLSALGRLIGTSHNRLHMAFKNPNISAELARDIHAKMPHIPLHRFRPDLWPEDKSSDTIA